MADLHDAMAYIIKNYPQEMRDELSNARLTKMIYLADWHQALNFGRQITSINWYFDNYGPFVHDVEHTARSRSDIFELRTTQNMYGSRKKKFELRSSSYEPTISGREKISLDHIIDVTRKLFWSDFIKLVYSTHPIASSERYTFLELLSKAKEYRRES